MQPTLMDQAEDSPTTLAPIDTEEQLEADGHFIVSESGELTETTTLMIDDSVTPHYEPSDEGESEEGPAGLEASSEVVEEENDADEGDTTYTTYTDENGDVIEKWLTVREDGVSIERIAIHSEEDDPMYLEELEAAKAAGEAEEGDDSEEEDEDEVEEGEDEVEDDDDDEEEDDEEDEEDEDDDEEDEDDDKDSNDSKQS
ncbi:hypothetical protein MKQ70_22855 [Chitinophaga sedimenti]|uniref:hypothetical protein n=1 Tax=Chitinophaga sedimenti TaxID=2033606 RepID=UPI002002D320|nr:hypothetical protein [Chitinophaga sedimenti]MCK7557689.1 hypothetical protein [Chitinophaga sedimenti]